MVHTSSIANIPVLTSARTEHTRSSSGDEMDGMEHVKESVSLEPEGSRDGTQSDDSITYPEGGLTAWSVAFSAWCSMMAAFGIINSMGVFQAYVSTTLLPSYSPDAIGWIFGIYVFVSYFCGVQIGPIFDAKGPTLLLVAGSVCMVGSTFALAHCTKYWHLIITLSLVNGIGSSLLFTPAMGAVAHWFHQRRGTATGFAFIGGGLGGVIFPLLVQPLLPQVGWAWTMRIVAFVQLVLCIVIVTLCRSRLPPKSSTSLTPTRDMLPDLRIFLDPAMAVTSAGVFFVEWAYFVPISYIPSYYLVRQGLATAGSATSSEAAFAYQLLAILNGVSCIGRFSAGYIADRAGRFNTMIISNLLCLLAVATFWMADTLIAKPPGSTLLVAFVAVFGFASGANITLIPICVGQLCDTRDYGRYYASAYSITSFGCLTGIPIAGRLLAVTGESGRRAFWGLVLFAAMSYVAAFLCFLWVRVYVKGWNLRVRW